MPGLNFSTMAFKNCGDTDKVSHEAVSDRDFIGTLVLY